MMDLKELFGDRFRIITDPAVGARNKDPWMWMIPCKRWLGEIYPHSMDKKILAFLGRSKKVKTALSILGGAGCEVQAEGDDEFIVTFPLDRAEAVFEIVQPRRLRPRRELTERERQEIIERTKRFRFKTETKVLKNGQI